jgi:hypothetical protein
VSKLLIQRIINATTFTVTTVLVGGYFTGVPKTPEAWGTLAGVVVAIWWGKFSSSKTVFAMNRPVWTDTQRAQEALAELNKGVK